MNGESLAWICASLIAVAVALLVDPPGGARLVAGLAMPRESDRPSLTVLRRLRELPFGPLERRRRQRARAATVESLAALAAELRAGAPVSLALQRAGVRQWPLAIAAIRRGGTPQDIARALENDARQAEILRPLAAAWALATTSGMALAPMVDGIAQWARAQEDVRDELQAQLAGPRATGRMLAALPAFAIIIGFGIGADPLGWLFGTPLGVLCVVGGLACTLSGLAWMGALSRRVERQL